MDEKIEISKSMSANKHFTIAVFVVMIIAAVYALSPNLKRQPKKNQNEGIEKSISNIEEIIKKGVSHEE